MGGEIKKIVKNLFAVEIDPVKAMEEYKKKFAPQMEKMEFLKGMGLEDTFDLAGMTPGIDEIAAFDKFLRYMNSRDYDIIIFDTAPTGHTLRLLSLPDVLESWVGKMINLRMKFAGIANLVKKVLPFGNPEEEGMGTDHLEEMKKRIGQAKIVLTNREKTHFWLVSIAEQMSLFETERAVKTLKNYNIYINGVIVNQLIPKNNCNFCIARRKMQEKNLKKIHQVFSGIEIKEIPLFSQEIAGFKNLEHVEKYLEF